MKHCGDKKPFSEEIANSYTSNLKKNNYIRDEYKNAIKMKKWREKIK